MNEFETLDEELSQDNGFSPRIKSFCATIAQWAKIIAIIGIASQVIDFGLKIGANGGSGIGGPLVGLGIAVGLHVSLFKFAQALTEFSENANSASFSRAMTRQRIYWQFLGILLIIVLVIVGLFVVAYGDKIMSNLHLIF